MSLVSLDVCCSLGSLVTKATVANFSFTGLTTLLGMARAEKHIQAESSLIEQVVWYLGGNLRQRDLRFMNISPQVAHSQLVKIPPSELLRRLNIPVDHGNAFTRV